MIPGELTSNVLESLIDEYKNAERQDFIDWNMDEPEDDDGRD